MVATCSGKSCPIDANKPERVAQEMGSNNKTNLGVDLFIGDYPGCKSIFDDNLAIGAH